jgi:DnaK suppressor protein
MQKKKQTKGKAVIVKKKPAGRSGGEVKKNNAAKKLAKKSTPKNIKKKEVKKPVSKKPLVKKPVKKLIVAKPVKKVAPKKEIKKIVKKALPKKNKKVVEPVKRGIVKKAAPAPKKEIKKEVIKKIEKKEVKKEMKKETKKMIQPEIKQKINMDTVVEKIRYSDEELIEFKDIILKKLEEAHRDLALLTEAYTTKNEHDTNDTSPTFKVLEEGSNVLSKEENSQLAARQKKFIRDLENAMIRIENKTYGICRVTGKLIPKERLRIVPHATMSIEAKLQQPQKR